MAQDAKPRKHLFNFTLSGMEELDLFPNEASRQKALEETSSEVRGRDIAIGAAVVGLSGTGSLILAKIVLRNVPFAVPGILNSTIPFLCAMGAVWVSLVILHRWGTREVLRKKLLHAGVPVCIKCGYLLRGLANGIESCPECGRKIDESARKILSADQSSL